jgi:hypothetical protein
MPWRDDNIKLEAHYLGDESLKEHSQGKEIGLEGALSERWSLKDVLKIRR